MARRWCSRPDRQLEVLATNKLDDKVDASLALVDGEIFVRGHQHLYCIGW
jgi:outer membrane protein assembly factor BamB